MNSGIRGASVRSDNSSSNDANATFFGMTHKTTGPMSGSIHCLNSRQSVDGGIRDDDSCKSVIWSVNTMDETYLRV